MKILFTGGSSFTGYWFIKKLAQAGHNVHATFTSKDISTYTGIRKERIIQLMPICEPVFECRFGSQIFMELLNDNWDILCHHAADVSDYKSQNFNVINALTDNTNQIKLVVEKLASNGCKSVLLTSSIFQQNEGIGSFPLRAFSPYGLSKGLTSDIFEFYCQINEIKLGKFVIPNPFGPFEEPRFTTFLAQSWVNGEIPKVNTPLYIRDNIHITPLAEAYLLFAVELFKENILLAKLNPSCYIEDQGSFTSRFSDEMVQRLNVPCEYELKNQTEFDEPLIRVNSLPISSYVGNWDEKICWDELAEYYLSNLGGSK